MIQQGCETAKTLCNTVAQNTLFCLHFILFLETNYSNLCFKMYHTPQKSLTEQTLQNPNDNIRCFTSLYECIVMN